MKAENTKVHTFAYVKSVDGENEGDSVLAVATEDGRILFYKTNDFVEAAKQEEKKEGEKEKAKESIPCARLIAQLGGKGWDHDQSEGLQGSSYSW